MTKLDGTRGRVTVSMPDFYRFTNIQLKVGIYSSGQSRWGKPAVDALKARTL